ncbi:prefoldin subunit 5 [Athalia rosae]|uniref:prefoldin subunit 5 n=1 Tax=Athalia rosae TaxID=37344 RepID=UPI0020339B30|nr:prefoldin subunit 5 [Athalia rosae]
MSQISANEGPKLEQIDLTNLNLQQLTQLKQNLDQELGVFQDSLQALKIAQNKFQESGTSLGKINPRAKGKEILVPLTSSMYVTGKLANTETVIVDIGTGYYAEKDIQGAKDYFTRRVNYVTEQMEKIQQIGLEKSRIREAIREVMEMKMQEQRAAMKESSEHS